MGAKVTFDPTATPFKLIRVTVAPTPDPVSGDPVIDLNVKVDLYSDGKEDWLASAALRKYRFPIEAVGGRSQPGGRVQGTSYFLRNDWKIEPYDADHALRIDGDLYRDDGGKLTVIRAGRTIEVSQQLSAIVVGFEQTTMDAIEQSVMATEVRMTDLWQIRGLDVLNPAVHSSSVIQSGFVSLGISEGPPGTFTVTRL